ncbi:MAG: hypothetical protein AEth_01051 [Candidatus Argoarchaeum ethanivorans]|uniref:Uncharacterized protein n=1 Tax=Candidatus Argoarchaeum ethanivorans TaxID=2608793 RepID=A0A8B3S2K6_9EURY|nr:MAG: hypothetical protein AEth_01051 [Candidatus Argoarchaeum ethanivorans]
MREFKNVLRSKCGALPPFGEPVKTELFFISDYWDVPCEPTRDRSHWILKELDRADRFKVYSTTNRVINSSCFRNINFPTLDYKGKIGDRFAGDGEPAFTVAEAGANHNRELNTAKIEKPW